MPILLIRTTLRLGLILVALNFLRAPPQAAAQTSDSAGLVAHAINRLTGFNRLSRLPIADQIQDPRGFMWFATNEGLVRFDGYEERVFVRDAADPESISSNQVTALEVGQDGSLWVGTAGGLNRLDLDRGVFRRFGWDGADSTTISRGAVRDILEDSKGRLWVATLWGLSLFDTQEGSFTRYVHQGADGSPASAISTLFESPDGMIWGGSTGQGVFRLDEESATLEHFLVDEARRGYNVVLAALVDSQGKMWIGTELGLGQVRLSNGSLEVFVAEEQLGTPPSRRVVSSLLEDRLGRVWFGGEGLSLFDRSSGATRQYRVGPEDLVDPSKGASPALERGPIRVASMTQDRQGTIWLGTNTGVYSLDSESESFVSERFQAEDSGSLPNNDVLALASDPRGGIWIGTDAGLSYRDSMIGHHPGRDFGETNPDDRPVSSLHMNSLGTLWVGSAVLMRGSPLLMESETGSSDGYSFDSFDPALADDIPSRRKTLRGMYADGNGGVWIGSYQGLKHFLSGSQLFEALRSGNGNSPLRMNSPNIVSTMVDRLGEVWAGSDRGVNRLLPGATEWSVTRYDPRVPGSLSDDRIRQILEDDRGRVWLATQNGGVNLLDRTTGLFREFSISTTDLPGNDIRTLIDDLEGNLWMGSIYGRIARLNPGTGEVRVFGPMDGLAYDGMITSATRDASGRLFFGGGDGLVSILPSGIHDNQNPPEVQLTDLYLFNERIVPGADGPLQRHIAVTDAIELSHFQNDITVQFSGMHYKDPTKNQYAVQLVGYEDDWDQIGTLRTATYSNLPSGDYTFRVKASNSDGVWSDGSTQVRLSVLPVFWASRWALLLYVSLLMGAMAAVLSMQKRRLGERENRRAAVDRAEARAVDLAQLDVMKTRFFANFSHELRTPLTLISGPLQRLRSGGLGPLTEEQEAQHDMMLRNTQRLQRLVNQILDLTRLEARSLTLNPTVDDLVEFTRSTVTMFGSLATHREIGLTFESELSSCKMSFDGEQMEKVLANLLSNALKFTPAGGTVRVDFKGALDFVEITVSDTGVGIAAEEVDHLFDRFFQADSGSSTHEGTGIGLALVRELVLLHGGTVRCASDLGVGSRFEVHLPRSVPDAGNVGLTEAVASASSVGELALAGFLTDSLDDESDAETTQDVTTVLVVDDNPDMRSHLRDILSDDFRVLEAENGSQGLDVVHESLPDLVISDVMMPVMDGFAMSRALKQDVLTDCIPVILLTARAGSEDAMEGLRSGADAYVPKPFDADVLLARVRNLIGLRLRLRERYAGAAQEEPAEDVPVRSAFERQVREFIGTHLADPELTVVRIAEELCLSPYQLARRLQEQAGMKPRALVSTLRLERAAVLLDAQEGKVSEVAYAVGFNSLSYFSRCFLEYHGISPSKFADRPGVREGKA